MHSIKSLLYGVAVLFLLVSVEISVNARPVAVSELDSRAAIPKLGGGGGGGLLSGIGKLFGGGKSTPAPAAPKAPPPPAPKPAPPPPPPAPKPAPPPPPPAPKPAPPPPPPAPKPAPPPPPAQKPPPTKPTNTPAKTTTAAPTKSADACLLPRAPGAPANSKCNDQAAQCARLQGCSQCVKNTKCGFSKTAFKCVPKAALNQVSSAVGCPQMDQMQGIFKAVNGQSKAGASVPAAVTAEFARVSSHIFNGEATSKTSGRHLSAVWTKDNPTSKKEGELAGTHIQKFSNGKTGKTVWDSAFYTDVDVKNMCSVAIELGNRDKVSEGAYVVQTPFGKPACINHFAKGTGSCFPLGIDAPSQKLGAKCGSAADDA